MRFFRDERDNRDYRDAETTGSSKVGAVKALSLTLSLAWEVGAVKALSLTTQNHQFPHNPQSKLRLRLSPQSP